jgi:hypothetical protein
LLEGDVTSDYPQQRDFLAALPCRRPLRSGHRQPITKLSAATMTEHELLKAIAERLDEDARVDKPSPLLPDEVVRMPTGTSRRPPVTRRRQEGRQRRRLTSRRP